MKNKSPLDVFFLIITYVAAAFTFFILALIIIYILVKGVPYIKPSLFALKYTSQNVSVFPAIISTIIITFISLIVAVPLGVLCAIYLIEYAKPGNKVVGLVRVATETLSGIPSIIYGLFGLVFFVTYLNWGFSVLAGSLTLAIMVLPSIIRTTEESLKSVPDSYREGSFGLGAGKLRTIFKIILPSSVPGILAGVILAIGRIVGETAALIYTSGTVAQIPSGNNFAFMSARTLSVHMYALSSEGLYTNEAYATAVVLIILVIGINSFSAFLARKIAKT